MKWLKAAVLALISLSGFGVILLFEIKGWPVGNSISGIVLGFSLPALVYSVQDLCDTTNWQASQRKLKRGGFITDQTIIRISFAYLFRIKVGNEYLLVNNARGTGKYQPVGGVYKLMGNEKAELKKRFQVKDDNKIPIDKSSRDDYRLRMESKYLRKFVKRFNGKAERERIENLGREFKEELVETGILDWSQISYRFCGRHMTALQFGEHFQIYELLLADVVELIPTEAQEKDLARLMEQNSNGYRFATAEEITALGVSVTTGELQETIADHSKKIIQENEGCLMKIPRVGNTYSVELT